MLLLRDSQDRIPDAIEFQVCGQLAALTLPGLCMGRPLCGPASGLAKQLRLLVTASRFQTSRWRERLIDVCWSRGLDPDRVLHETDAAGLMEGLCLKVERRLYLSLLPFFAHRGEPGLRS